jgi:hypothetical protein
MRVCVLLGVLALSTTVVAPSASAESLTLQRQPVTWTGTLSQPDLTGCDTLSACDVRALTVVAAKGTWITVRVSDDNDYLAVRHDGFTVGGNGTALVATRTGQDVSRPVTTFQQVAPGRVTYQVLVGSSSVTPATPAAYRGEAAFAGRAFDRQGDCGLADAGLSALSQPDDGRTLRLSVRMVASPQDATVMRQAGRTLAETYARIGIAVRIGYDVMPLKDDGTYPFVQVRRKYGGVRPHGVDVVHVLSDDFAGGYAECIGGIAYPERGFSNGSAHYALNGDIPIDRLPAGMIAAHEVGHQLGAHHEMVSCVEALPQQVRQPASDGWVGPCTVMGPLAVQDSETFSMAERATVRAFVRRWAGRW